MNKYCIYHVPNYISKEQKSATSVRPLKMLDAFKNIGYNVDVIMGYGKERKKQIKQIKTNIKQGVKYDFVYSESSTMPTLLTEKNHIPLYPFLDFGFFRYCKKHGIKIALFYRDMHWKFDLYKKNVSLLKRSVAIPMYKYDLHQYRKYLDILYLASKEVKKYLTGFEHVDTLPPGTQVDQNVYNNTMNKLVQRQKNNTLHIFYVGGLSKEIYSFSKLLEAVNNVENIYLTISCREAEWLKNKTQYEPYLKCGRINIVHASGDELKKYYEQADVCSLFFEPTVYMSIAMPVKLFEYLSNFLPMIATSNTVSGRFVSQYDCGWSISYSTSELEKLLTDLRDNKEKIYKKAYNMLNLVKNNTWEKRAQKVQNDLLK